MFTPWEATDFATFGGHVIPSKFVIYTMIWIIILWIKLFSWVPEFSWIDETLHFRGYVILWLCQNLDGTSWKFCILLNIYIRVPTKPMEIGDATNSYGSTVCTLKSNQSIKDVIFQYSTTYPQDEEQLFKYNPF